MTTLKEDVIVTGCGGSPAWSSDGLQLAVDRSGPGFFEGPTGYPFLVINADGSGKRNPVQFENNDTFYTNPVWTPDGSTIYFAYSINTMNNGGGGLISTEVRALDVASGVMRLIVPGPAWAPTLSPDGRTLAYIVPSGLWIANAADGSSPRQLLPASLFSIGILSRPQFVEHGEAIVFAAQGMLATSAPTSQDPSARATRWMEEHAAPVGLWRIGLDGTGLQRLMWLDQDTWDWALSPDGQWIAASGVNGIEVTDLNREHLIRVSDQRGGWIAWGEATGH
jgi:Tol biopolymer transport system component